MELSLEDWRVGSFLGSENEAKEVPLEFEFTFDDEDGTDERKQTWQTLVTIRREAAWDELDQVDPQAWQRPPFRKSIVPFGQNNLLLGDKHFVHEFVPDSATPTLEIDHNLGGELLKPVVRIIENPDDGTSVGLQLTDDEYEVYAGADKVTISFLSPLIVEATYQILLSAANRTPAFVEGLTVTQSQVEGLPELLSQILGDIATLFNLMPAEGALSGPPRGTIINEFSLPQINFHFPPEPAAPAEAADSDGGALVDGHPVAVLPAAVHEAAIEPLPSDQILSPGQVYEAEGDAGLVRPESGPMYHVQQINPAETSWYPLALRVPLFEFALSPQLLAPGAKVDCEFGFVAALHANVCARFRLRVEFGYPQEEAAPAPIGGNLEDIIWDVENPVIDAVVSLSTTEQTHRFGFHLLRSADGDSFTITRQLYLSLQNATAPAGDPEQPLKIRAFLGGFDLENEAPFGCVPKGSLHIAGLDAHADSADSSTIGKVIITQS